MISFVGIGSSAHVADEADFIHFNTASLVDGWNSVNGAHEIGGALVIRDFYNFTDEKCVWFKIILFR